jgi:hypothetical protein
MRPQVLVRIVVVMLCVMSGPLLFACETCITGGQVDPSGGSSTFTRCYASPDGMYELCWPPANGIGNCTMDDTDPFACPESSSGGGGDIGGGGGDGGGSGGCSYDDTGACSAECASCGPWNRY